jgi:hypothetical protein
VFVSLASQVWRANSNSAFKLYLFQGIQVKEVKISRKYNSFQMLADQGQRPPYSLPTSDILTDPHLTIS